VCVSHFPLLSVFLQYSRCFLPYSRSYSVCFSFFMFFSILDLLQVLESAFLIFQVFSVSRHDSRNNVYISHFPWFSVCSKYSRSYSVHFSFYMFFLFVCFWPYFMSNSVSVPFSKFFTIFRSYSLHFSFFTFFSLSCHISSPVLCVSHFPWLSIFSP
jgi:hypothetical protein